MQRRIERECRMALRQDHPIAHVTLQPAVHNVAVEHGHYVRDAQSRANVPFVRSVRLIEDDATDACGGEHSRYQGR